MPPFMNFITRLVKKAHHAEEELTGEVLVAPTFLEYFLRTEDARRPRKTCSGYELFAVTGGMIPARGTLELATEVVVKIPEGCCGRILPADGQWQRSVTAANSPLINGGVPTHVTVVLTNHHNELLPETTFEVEPGDRIGLLLLEPTQATVPEEGENADRLRELIAMLDARRTRLQAEAVAFRAHLPIMQAKMREQLVVEGELDEAKVQLKGCRQKEDAERRVKLAHGLAQQLCSAHVFKDTPKYDTLQRMVAVRAARDPLFLPMFEERASLLRGRGMLDADTRAEIAKAKAEAEAAAEAARLAAEAAAAVQAAADAEAARIRREDERLRKIASRERHDKNAAGLDILARGRTPDWRAKWEGQLEVSTGAAAAEQEQLAGGGGVGTRVSMFWWAAEAGDVPMMQRLTADAAEEQNESWQATAVDGHALMGQTPLCVAAAAGQEEACSWLVEVAAAAPDLPSIDGRSPLWLAAAAGHLDVARYLAAAGADCGQPSAAGKTPLHAAAAGGQLECAEWLCTDCAGAGGGGEEGGGSGMDPAALDADGETALFAAAVAGHMPVVRFLLQHHPATGTKANTAGWTPFFAACRAGQLEVVQVPASLPASQPAAEPLVPSSH